MSDVFREVDEAVREDRFKTLAKRYGSWVLTAAVAVVVGAVGYQVWQAQETEARQAETHQLLAAVNMAAQAPAEAAEALSSVAQQAGGERAVFAQLLRAGLLAESGDSDGAVAIYRGLAAETGVTPLWRDYAILMSVAHTIETGDPALLSDSLDRLTGEDSPWRYSARELAGVLSLRQGDTEAARETFQALADDPMAPRGLRDRARSLADYLEE